MNFTCSYCKSCFEFSPIIINTDKITISKLCSLACLSSHLLRSPCDINYINRYFKNTPESCIVLLKSF